MMFRDMMIATRLLRFLRILGSLKMLNVKQGVTNTMGHGRGFLARSARDGGSGTSTVRPGYWVMAEMDVLWGAERSYSLVMRAGRNSG